MAKNGKKAQSQNEATLEVRLGKVLTRLFPHLVLDHQTTFTVRIGAGEHTIDGRSNWAKGRADVLIRYGNRPLAIIELKAPGEVLTSAASSQAVTYARLVEPMAPLVIVTNGSNSVLLRSYDREVLEIGTLDERVVADLFAHAGELADADRDAAIRDLLDRENAAFARLLSDASLRTIGSLTGSVFDLTKPVSAEFQLARGAVDELASLVHANERVCVLVGPALSGRTNVLAQFCKRPDITSLFIDAEEVYHGPLRYMANVVGRGVFRRVDSDDVRHWLRHRLAIPGDRPVAIVVDGWGSASGDRIRSDISELMQLCEESGVCLVTVMDEVWFDELSRGPSQRLTPFGRRAKKVELLPLSRNEYERAAEHLTYDWQLQLDRRTSYCADYRQPRVLRLLVATKPPGKPQIDEERGLMAVVRLPASAGVFLPDLTWNRLASPGARDDLMAFARAVLEWPDDERDLSTILRIAGQGAMPLRYAEGTLGIDRLDRLRRFGLVSYIEAPSGKRYVYPRVPEMLAQAAVNVMADVLADWPVASAADAKDVYDGLLAGCQRFPMADIVGAAVLRRVSDADGARAAYLIETLLDDQPDVSHVSAGSTIITQMPGGGVRELELPDGGGYRTVGNDLPFLILSHLLAQPMAASRHGGEERAGDANLHMAAVVGAVPHILFRIDPRLNEWLGVSTHDLPEGGVVICPTDGVIEPVTDSMAQFLENPVLRPRALELIDAFAAQAVSEPVKPALLIRSWTALSMLQRSTDAELAVAAYKARNRILGPAFNALVSSLHPDEPATTTGDRR